MDATTPLPDLENVPSSDLDNWSLKVQDRKGAGSERIRYLKNNPSHLQNQIKGCS